MSSTLGELVSGRSLAVVAGTGGVGKTTTAAALALAAATEVEGDILVLTIDPARRLASALGVEIEGNVAHEIPLPGESRGRVFAAMLDPGPAWDHMVRSESPDQEVAERILVNPVYRRIADTFVHGNDYAALSWLDEAISSEDYRLIIVDTPPSQSAAGLFDAPEQVEAFFTSSLLGWLTKGEAGTLIGGPAAKSFAAVADRLLGAEFFGSVVEFFQLMHTVVPGMVARTKVVAEELAGDDAAFIAVAAPTEHSLDGVRSLVSELKSRDIQVDALVVNGVEPAVYGSAKTRDVAERVHVGDKSPFTQTATTLLQPGADYVLERCVVAEDQRQTIARGPDVVRYTTPRTVHSPNDVEALLALGQSLWSAEPTTSGEET